MQAMPTTPLAAHGAHRRREGLRGCHQIGVKTLLHSVDLAGRQSDGPGAAAAGGPGGDQAARRGRATGGSPILANRSGCVVER